jgi:aminoglycoside 3-N-acetyltransferase
MKNFTGVINLYTQKHLVNQIEAMGIKPTDLLTIHISLKSIGEIDTSEKTSAEVVIDALRYSVRDGLLLIPSHTYSNIRKLPVFDVRTTVPCIGAVPTVAVQIANKAYDCGDKNIVRSLHPGHSVVAFGKNAYEYVADDAKAATPMPQFGSYRKLEQQNGKIMLIGVDLKNNTFIHAIDEYMEPNGVSAPYPITVIDYNGNKTERFACNCKGPSASYPKYHPYLEKSGAITYGKLGDADVILCDAKKTFDTIVEVWHALYEEKKV